MAPEVTTHDHRWPIPPIVVGLVVACVAIAAMNWWLWHDRQAFSTDLLFLQARAALALEQAPPTGVLLTAPPAVLYMTMLTGSAVWAAALAASIAVVVLASIAARRRSRFVWALALVVQPVVVLGASGYPGLLLATACMAAAVSGLVEYFRRPRLNSLTNGALALGALVLLDWDMWPLWIVLAAGITIAVRHPWPERLTLCLVALFPALAASGTWLYLNRTDTGWTWFFRDMPELSLAHLEGWRIEAALSPPFGPFAIFACAAAALLFSPIVIGWRDAGWRLRAGIAILLGAPLVMLVLRTWLAGPVPALQASAFGLATGVVVIGSLEGRALRAAAFVLLLIGAVPGWYGVLTAGGEPAALVAAAVRGTPVPTLAGAARLAGTIQDKRGPLDRVLVDDVGLFPVVALLDEGSWISSSSWDFTIAAQQPAHWARFVVDAEGGSPMAAQSRLHVRPDILARDYTIAAVEGPLRLYERRADWKTGR